MHINNSLKGFCSGTYLADLGGVHGVPAPNFRSFCRELKARLPNFRANVFCVTNRHQIVVNKHLTTLKFREVQGEKVGLRFWITSRDKLRKELNDQPLEDSLLIPIKGRRDLRIGDRVVILPRSHYNSGSQYNSDRIKIIQGQQLTEVIQGIGSTLVHLNGRSLICPFLNGNVLVRVRRVTSSDYEFPSLQRKHNPGNHDTFTTYFPRTSCTLYRSVSEKI